MGKYDEYFENEYYKNVDTSRSQRDVDWEASQRRVQTDMDMRNTTVKRTDPFATKGAKKIPMLGFGIGMGIDTVLNMKSGDDFGTAAVKGAFTGMLWTTAPWVMGAMELGKAVPQVYEGYYNWKRQKEQWWNMQHLPNFGGNYQDTRRALTMRQAAVEAIQGSKMNARSALGGEAKLLHSNFNR